MSMRKFAIGLAGAVLIATTQAATALPITGPVRDPQDQWVLEQAWPSSFRLDGPCTWTREGQPPVMCRDVRFAMLGESLASIVAETDEGRLVTGGDISFNPDFLRQWRSGDTSTAMIAGDAIGLSGRKIESRILCRLELSSDLDSAAGLACSSAAGVLRIEPGPLVTLSPPWGSAIPAQVRIAGCGTLTIDRRATPCTAMGIARDRNLRHGGLSLVTAEGPINLLGSVRVQGARISLTVGRLTHRGRSMPAGGTCRLGLDTAAGTLTRAICDLEVGIPVGVAGHRMVPLTFALGDEALPMTIEREAFDARTVLLSRLNRN